MFRTELVVDFSSMPVSLATECKQMTMILMIRKFT
jgi:hypothetical protein